MSFIFKKFLVGLGSCLCLISNIDNDKIFAYNNIAVKGNSQNMIKPNSYKLNVPLYSQVSPSFIPMGCECVSAQMAFSYKGLDIDIHNFINEVPFSYDPREGFVGDMYSIVYYNGTVPTVWPEGLIKSIKNYRPNSYVANGITLDNIENEILAGNPVIMWYAWQPTNIALLTSGSPIYSSTALHAVLAVGYDEENLYINDPALGYRKLNKDIFYKKYESYGSRALVIK